MNNSKVKAQQNGAGTEAISGFLVRDFNVKAQRCKKAPQKYTWPKETYNDLASELEIIEDNQEKKLKKNLKKISVLDFWHFDGFEL